MTSDEIREYANTLLAAGRQSDAAQILKHGKRLFPNDPKIRNNLGQLLVLLGQHDEARLELMDATSIDPAIEVAWVTLIRLTIAAASYDYAKILLEDAAAHGLREEVLLPFRLSILNYTGMHSLALVYARNSYDQHCNNEIFVTEFLVSLAHCDLPAEGIQVATQFLSKYPASVDVALQLGLLYQQVGKSDLAIALLQSVKACSRMQKLGIAQAQVTMYEDLGLVDQAISCAEYCISNNLDVYRNSHILFGLHASKGNWSSAFSYNKSRWLGVPRPDFADSGTLPCWSPRVTSSRTYIYAEQGLGDQLFAYKVLAHYTLSEPNDNLFFFEVSPKLSQFLPSIGQILILPSKKRPIQAESLYTHHISMYELIEKILLHVDPKELFADTEIHKLISHHVNQRVLSLGNSCLTDLPPVSPCLGISWRTNNRQVGKEQSIDLQTILDALHDLHVSDALSLQYLPTTKEQMLAKNHIVNLYIPNTDTYTDILANAILISSSSSILSVSTFTAHLSGLLGISTALLLSPGRAKTWYWYLALNDYSLVYPSIKFFEKERRTDSWRQSVRSAISIM